mgnify:CR=1 FL=1
MSCCCGKSCSEWEGLDFQIFLLSPLVVEKARTFHFIFRNVNSDSCVRMKKSLNSKAICYVGKKNCCKKSLSTPFEVDFNVILIYLTLKFISGVVLMIIWIIGENLMQFFSFQNFKNLCPINHTGLHCLLNSQYIKNSRSSKNKSLKWTTHPIHIKLHHKLIDLWLSLEKCSSRQQSCFHVPLNHLILIL